MNIENRTPVRRPKSDRSNPVKSSTDMPRGGSVWRLHDLLTTTQIAEFRKFQALCASREEKPDLDHQESREGIDDEPTLLRFFQAREYDAQKAWDHFGQARRDRKQYNINAFYREMDVSAYEETSALYPQWTGRRGKNGQPIYILDLAKLNSTNIAAHKATSDSMVLSESVKADSHQVSVDVLRAFAIHEHLTRFVLPLCSAVPDRPDTNLPVTKQLIIADITGVSVAKVWSLRNYIQDFSKLLAVNYPEVLDTVFIVGAPYLFSMAFSWIKAWVDAPTFAKLKLVNSKDAFSVLSMYIDPENIPKMYGGGFGTSMAEKWPRLDRSIIGALTWSPGVEVLPSGPVLWYLREDGSRTAVAVGTSGAQGRKVEVARLSGRSEVD